MYPLQTQNQQRTGKKERKKKRTWEVLYGHAKCNSFLFPLFLFILILSGFGKEIWAEWEGDAGGGSLMIIHAHLFSLSFFTFHFTFLFLTNSIMPRHQNLNHKFESQMRWHLSHYQILMAYLCTFEGNHMSENILKATACPNTFWRQLYVQRHFKGNHMSKGNLDVRRHQYLWRQPYFRRQQYFLNNLTHI